MPRLMIKASLLLMVVLALSGCVSRQVQTLADLPLPTAVSENCCWQALQQLDIGFKGQHYQLTGVLAQTRAGVSLVLLDPFGRRVLSVTKQGDAVKTYRSPELPKALPEQFLLASSMLVWWPFADWQTGLASSREWQLQISGDSRKLSYHHRPLVTATYPQLSSSVSKGMNAETALRQEKVILRHHYQPLTIAIVTQSRELLE